MTTVPPDHHGIHLFSTCPQSKDHPRESYLQRVADVARWSEQAGCRGILVYTDNGLVDPWLVAAWIAQHTERLSPLVAVQPAYMHPYAVAKMVASLAHLHGRRTFLNMVAGGFKNDQLALGDATPHDRRYERLVEYTSIIERLLAGSGGVTVGGTFYSVSNLRMTPPLPRELMPEIFISGSSEEGLRAARACGATAVKYPKPAEVEGLETALDGSKAGIRVGIIARASGEAAWQIAHERFPEDRKGQIAHQLAMKVSDSVWHKQISELATAHPAAADDPYWMVPFLNYKTFCPYLVGSYQRVGAELSRYVALGFRTFILDIPPDREELDHVGAVFARVAG
jgi:alkanesulfonate monooxygenase